MLGNAVFSAESLAPNHFVFGAQLAPGEKKVGRYTCLVFNVQTDCKLL